VADPLNHNAIETLARRVFAHLWPLTGTRASGTATFSAPAGPAPVTLTKNAYLLPIVGGEAVDHRLYKVSANPATADGSWVIPAGGSLSVAVHSNIGGGQMNLPATARLRFDPKYPGLDQVGDLDAAITNGTNLCSSLFGDAEGEEALLKRMVFWQQMQTAESAQEFFRAASGDFPAMLMIWTRSVPMQGRTTGGAQGNTRAGRGQRIFREGFECFIGSGSLQGASKRRSQAMTAMQAATMLLSDSQHNVDGETLSSVAGLEITSRRFAVAEQAHYIYQFGFDANATYERVLRRTFGPWDLNHIQVLVPGREAPEPTGELELVDVTDPMP
jgi:hypothetical protein